MVSWRDQPCVGQIKARSALVQVDSGVWNEMHVVTEPNEDYNTRRNHLKSFGRHGIALVKACVRRSNKSQPG